jgi:hypothetical protein
MAASSQSAAVFEEDPDLLGIVSVPIGVGKIEREK